MTDIYPDVILRLKTLGIKQINEQQVRYAIEQAQEEIKNNVNQKEIPEGLRTVFIEMACGLFLNALKTFGLLNLETVDFEAPAKTIKEGDVQITFASASDGTLTPEARFDAMINSMINPSGDVFAKYRRLVW